jgi:hypothetical protein
MQDGKDPRPLNISAVLCECSSPTNNLLTKWSFLIFYPNLEQIILITKSVLGCALSGCPINTRGADKSLARPTSRCILFDVENISFDASLVIYINSTNIPPIVIMNRIYEHQNLLSL